MVRVEKVWCYVQKHGKFQKDLENCSGWLCKADVTEGPSSCRAVCPATLEKLLSNSRCTQQE